MRENEYKVNDYITLKLEGGKTAIYVDGRRFNHCMQLVLTIPASDVEKTNDYDSIDEIASYFKSTGGDKFSISWIHEFWAHCSNLQAWVDNGYDTRLLHRSLAFPLLKELVDAGDDQAKGALRTEIISRISSGFITVMLYLSELGYLKYLDSSDIWKLLQEQEHHDPRTRIMMLKELYTRADDDKAYRILEEELKRVLETGDEKLTNYIVKWNLLSYIPEGELTDILNSLVENENYLLLGKIFQKKGIEVFNRVVHGDLNKTVQEVYKIMLTTELEGYPNESEFFIRKCKEISEWSHVKPSTPAIRKIHDYHCSKERLDEILRGAKPAKSLSYSDDDFIEILEGIYEWTGIKVDETNSEYIYDYLLSRDRLDILLTEAESFEGSFEWNTDYILGNLMKFLKISGSRPSGDQVQNYYKILFSCRWNINRWDWDKYMIYCDIPGSLAKALYGMIPRYPYDETIQMAYKVMLEHGNVAFREGFAEDLESWTKKPPSKELVQEMSGKLKHPAMDEYHYLIEGIEDEYYRDTYEMLEDFHKRATKIFKNTKIKPDTEFAEKTYDLFKKHSKNGYIEYEYFDWILKFTGESWSTEFAEKVINEKMEEGEFYMLDLIGERTGYIPTRGTIERIMNHYAEADKDCNFWDEVIPFIKWLGSNLPGDVLSSFFKQVILSLDYEDIEYFLRETGFKPDKESTKLILEKGYDELLNSKEVKKNG
ncbi:MAG: hypothetical protein ACFFCS_27645 [Candidatus Hodarchaeota archaeon]